MKYVCQWKSIDNECNECRDYFNSEHIFEPTEDGGLLE